MNTYERKLFFAPLLRLFILLRQYDKQPDQVLKNLIQGALLACYECGASIEAINKILLSNESDQFLALIGFNVNQFKYK